MLNIVSATDGVWNGVIRYPEQERKAELEQNKEIEQSAFLQNIGYARLENAENENKPYLFVAGYSEKLTDLIPVSYTHLNSKVAEVTDKGVVKAKKAGTAKITVTSADGRCV